jgi:uncharacterized protein (TIGR03435 family)
MPELVRNPRCRSLLLLAALTATSLSAQTGSAPPADTASTKPISFDVVSIRPVHTDTRHFGPPFPKNGDGVVLEYVPAGWVIRLAYGIDRDNHILGLPDWAGENNWDVRFDIRAKVAETDVPVWQAMSNSQRWQVVQRLLADRFHLKLHHETVQRPIYALVLAKGGARITSVPPAPDSNKSWIELHAPGITNYHHVTMDTLAHNLAGSVGRDVFDRTGLTGNYDFTLKYSKATISTADPSASDPDFPDIFTAIQEEIGLKLEPVAGPVDVLVVDHIEKPSEN